MKKLEMKKSPVQRRLLSGNGITPKSVKRLLNGQERGNTGV